jgi:hypothetical protein
MSINVRVSYTHIILLRARIKYTLVHPEIYIFSDSSLYPPPSPPPLHYDLATVLFDIPVILRRQTHLWIAYN